MGKEFNRALITVGERNFHVLNHRKSSFIFKVILIDSILKTYSSIVCKIRIFCQQSETGKLDDLCVFVLLGTYSGDITTLFFYHKSHGNPSQDTYP